MKQTIKTFSVALMGLAMGTGAFAQTAYKGQLYVNNEKFCLQGEVLRVQLRVSYDDDILNSGETLNFTPVLKSGNSTNGGSAHLLAGSRMTISAIPTIL